jgi:GT2 family glycosyltransferase
LRSDYGDYRVIVCDNDSGDGSLEQTKSWAEGRLEAEASADNPLRGLSYPPVPKPIRYVEYDRDQAESGCDPTGARLILVQNGANLGFAGGSNVGVRCALACNDADYVWLLNNDTVVRPDSLRKMVERLEESPNAAMCGAKLLYYHNPAVVQVLGGATYSKWFGLGRHIGLFRPADEPVDAGRVEKDMSYVAAACMLVSSAFLRDVGPMSEDYFLYFEEIDWTLRANGRYTLAYAGDSIVYHKEGASIGANNDRADEKSLISDFYSIRNRIKVTRRFFPYALPTVYLGLVGTMVNRARRRQWDRLWMVVRIMFGSRWTPWRKVKSAKSKV